MTRKPSLHRIASLLLAAALCLVGLSLARSSEAGALRIRDDAHVLSAADSQELRSAVASLPFDAELEVTTDYPEVRDLAHQARSLATERGNVAVALDPEHRHVQVWFAAGSRVPPADRPQIERAGNDAFHRHAWAEGVTDIFRAAGAASVPVVEAPAAGRSLVGPGLILLIVVGVIGFAIFSARRRFYDQSYGGAYGPPGPYPGGYSGPQPGGMGPLGGGLIGAGLGGLAGYELGKMEGEREERERDGSRSGGDGGRDDSSGGYEAGGGGSSWDGGGDSGGGGFDGGGGDSGGGGSDF